MNFHRMDVSTIKRHRQLFLLIIATKLKHQKVTTFVVFHPPILSKDFFQRYSNYKICINFKQDEYAIVLQNTFIIRNNCVSTFG